MRAIPSFRDLVGPRLAVTQNEGELIAVERILAAARLLLALSSLLAVYFDPTPPTQYGHFVMILLVLYIAHCLALVAIVNRRTEISNRFALLVHAGDLLWPTAISVFTNGANSPFFFYFTFTLLAAAFRWGMRATLATTIGTLVIIVAEASPLTGQLREWIQTSFNLNGFLLRETYLAVFGILIGYLAEVVKRQHAQVLSAANIGGKARVDLGMKGTMRATLPEILGLFDARGLLLSVEETRSQQAYLWRVEIAPENREVSFSGRQLNELEEQRYMFATPEGCVAAAWRGNRTASVVTIYDRRNRARDGKCILATGFTAEHPHQTLLMGSVSAAPGILVRLFLMEPRLGGRTETQLQILQDLINSVAPAVYNVYLLRRLRSRATTAERGRVARELHDGVVQSLHAIAFRLYALRTSRDPAVVEIKQELTEIQELVQNEATNLRALIRHLEPLDFDPRHLLDFLTRMIEQFRYDTGIGAQFVCDFADVGLPPSTCRELAGIVREALANVLKHSGAENVLLRLGMQQGACVLTIEDDGRGFEFSGRMTHTQLKDSRRGPLLIKDRVRAIGGQLTIESSPGQGSRLEIKFPRQAEDRIA
jgi:signal transduction histidine kinase